MKASDGTRDSNEQLQSFFNNVAIGIYRTTPDGCILMANPALLRMLGYNSFDELSTRNLEQEGFEEADSRKEFKEMLAHTGEVKGLESAWTRRDGSAMTVRENVVMVRGENGAISYYEGTVEDITERKHAEDKLKRTQAEYRELYETAPVGYHEIDKNGIIIRVNQTEADLLGYRPEEMIGQPVFAFAEESTVSQIAIREKIEEKRPLIAFERRLRRKDGSLIDVHIKDCLVRDENGCVIGIRTTIQDISERIRAEEKLKIFAAELERSNRELQDFASVASHDLQEPLRKIQAFGDRLKAKCGETMSAEAHDYLERMRSAAGRMQTLINDLLTFSRVTTNAQPFVPIELKRIAEEVVIDLEVRIESTGGHIEIGELPMIEGDSVQMRQLLQNLIGNALKFHSAGQPPIVKLHGQLIEDQTENVALNANLQVNTDLQDSSKIKMCQITVEDNGIGFDEKYLDRIFTVFQRLHGRAAYEGTGVGLAVCRKIAERHGGSITARSTPGSGSTFIINLPVTHANGENSE